MAAQQSIQSTTQKFLDIYDVTNNLVVLKDGSACFVLSVSAMNFGLLAEQEQDAVIYTYAALLNSLNYPIQIVIQSQTKDATRYLNLLKEQEQKASNEKKSEMIARYRSFVSQLIKERNVLDKKFYVAVSTTALELGLITPEGFLPGNTQFDITKFEKTVILEKAQSILEPRRDHLINQFARIGLFARQLATQEIIKIFYTNYNSEASEGLEIANTNEYTTPLVRANLIKKRAALPQKQPETSKQNFTEYYQEQNSNNMQQDQQNPTTQINQSQTPAVNPTQQSAGETISKQPQEPAASTTPPMQPIQQEGQSPAATNTPTPTQPAIPTPSAQTAATPALNTSVVTPTPTTSSSFVEDISSFSVPTSQTSQPTSQTSQPENKPSDPINPLPQTGTTNPAESAATTPVLNNDQSISSQNILQTANITPGNKTVDDTTQLKTKVENNSPKPADQITAPTETLPLPKPSRDESANSQKSVLKSPENTNAAITNQTPEKEADSNQTGSNNIQQMINATVGEIGQSNQLSSTKQKEPEIEGVQQNKKDLVEQKVEKIPTIK